MGQTYGLPQYVTVVNLISAEELWKTLRLREANIWRALNDNQRLQMEYHTSIGERIRVEHRQKGV
jgi:hypothetical protein